MSGREAREGNTNKLMTQFVSAAFGNAKLTLLPASLFSKQKQTNELLMVFVFVEFSVDETNSSSRKFVLIS